MLQFMRTTGMKRINDIFYSLQGEGRNTGRAAVFVRFAGCNLKCPFCDTDFDDFNEMDDAAILREVGRWPHASWCSLGRAFAAGRRGTG